MTDIAANFERIQAQIAAAAGRAGRDGNSVKLLGASKTVEAERIRAAITAGLCLFGENRIQEATSKMDDVGGAARWHFIGHLQSNKVRVAVELFEMIESVDSLTLAREIDKWAERAGKTMPILVEVNVAGEKSKFGFKPDALLSQIAEINSLGHLAVHGLMAIPPYCENPEESRLYFRSVREWKERIEKEAGVPMVELSMGMSHDFEVAVEEGATIVRVGEALFGPRTKKKMDLTFESD